MKHITLDWDTYQNELEEQRKFGHRELLVDMKNLLIQIREKEEFVDGFDLFDTDAYEYLTYREMILLLNELKGFKP